MVEDAVVVLASIVRVLGLEVVLEETVSILEVARFLEDLTDSEGVCGFSAAYLTVDAFLRASFLQRTVMSSLTLVLTLSVVGRKELVCGSMHVECASRSR